MASVKNAHIQIDWSSKTANISYDAEIIDKDTNDITVIPKSATICLVLSEATINEIEQQVYNGLGVSEKIADLYTKATSKEIIK